MIHNLLFLLVLAVETFNSVSSAKFKVDASKVIILLSHGRSGSSELAGVLGNIFNSWFGNELLGSNTQQMKDLVDPYNTMLRFLASAQAKKPGKFVGFKWKPYFHNDEFQKAWVWMSVNNVKVVYNTRNPLDVIISTMRTHDQNGVYNCQANDPNCIETQKSITTKLNIPVVQEQLTHLEEEYIKIAAQLRENNISYYHVTYEGINYGTMQQRIKYVQTMTDYIQPGLTITNKVFDVHTAPIGHYHQNESVLNYNELVTALKNTRYEQYLH